ncbi:4-hydroxy-2-oxoglutarate aldolase, mitochondrial-like [Bradysia coprophila]|uniref:4-hydroxy-2-oxoglutarate aldolase, mitochondrial-like n=1 Tax=Bradysia coprophila TaxID=38358 RepID=UPI00187DC71C|nr:4-hydroxy-2-oxoglutarate aldolase, mitochondrial-like [Bradysia coprophila]
MNKSKLNLSGIIVAIATPFQNNPQQSVNYDKLTENVAQWEKIPFAGYCIGGSYGEWPFLTNDEKIQILKTVKSLAHPSKFVMAGTTSESTKQSLDLSLAVAEAGADAILLQAPHYFRSRMTQNSIVEHFTTIADVIPIPVVIYNNPGTTGIDIGVDTIDILSNHPNIIGVKDGNAFKLGAIVEKTKNKEFQVLASSAGDLLPALLMGCCGGMSGLAGILGGPICEMFTLAQANEWRKAAEIEKRLVLPDFLLLKEYGPPALKAAMDMLGYYGGSCRKPLLPLDPEVISNIRQVLQTNGHL